jgi:hypothetical protein
MRSRGARRMRLLAGSAALVLFSLGCVPGIGPVRLPAVEGRVVDAQSGAPLAGAEVVEWWYGAGRFGGPQPVQHARWDTTDAAGRFALAGSTAWSPRMWLLRTYGPAYSVFHADYGLLHAGLRSEAAPLVLRIDRAAASQGATELAAICRGERDDSGARRLRAVACAPRPTRNPAP